jgi:FMN-dependent NADH-azoreductase
MTSILLVTSSPRGQASYSNKVAGALVEELKTRNGGASLVVRDLSAETLPHIDQSFVAATYTDEASRSAEQREALATSDRLIAELRAADIIVIASAMINFGPATTLKAWFDHVIRRGVTFAYAEKGPKGLLTGKKVFVVEARGGVYSDGPLKVIDFQEPYLRHLLGFIGLTDVSFIHVEGVGLGPEAAKKAVDSALSSIPQLLAA